MSVPAWKRKLSSAEYIYKVYRLNIRLGEILVNKPKKYKGNYTDEIIKTALHALKKVQKADDIYMSKTTSKEDYLIRRKHLLSARGDIRHLATACYVFLELVRKHDYSSDSRESERLYPKLSDQEDEIGALCEECRRLINGVLKSDNALYRQGVREKEKAEARA